MDRTRAALLAIGLLAAVTGPVGTAGAATRGTEVEDYRFAPEQVRIEPGDRVRWTNHGDQVHTVTSDDFGAEDFDSGRLGEDDEFTHTFRDPGTYRYHCEIYSSMKGVVQVGEPPPTTTTQPPTTTTTTPAPTTTTTVAPGTTTTVAPGTTTTTVAPTTTTAPPAPPDTTTTTGRSPAGAQAPVPTPSSAPTTATTAPPTTTSTPAAETTTSTVPGAVASDAPLGPDVPDPEPPPPEDGEGDLAGEGAAPLPSRDSGGGNRAGVLLLMAAVFGAGLFGGWTLWKLRPGKA